MPPKRKQSKEPRPPRPKGGDGNNTTTGKKRGKQPKHRHDSAATTTAKTTDLDRPDPTPRPPQALVNLLQNDADVVSYFVSLQSNLDYDVERWKQRAKTAQAENEKLTRQLLRSLEHQQKKSSSPPNASLSAKRKRPPPTTIEVLHQNHHHHQGEDKGPSCSEDENDQDVCHDDDDIVTHNSFRVSEKKFDRTTMPFVKTTTTTDAAAHNPKENDGSNDNNPHQPSSTDLWDDPAFDLEFSSSSSSSSSDEECDISTREQKGENDGGGGRQDEVAILNKSHAASHRLRGVAEDRDRDRNGRAVVVGQQRSCHAEEIETDSGEGLPDNISSPNRHFMDAAGAEPLGVVPGRIQSAWENLLAAQHHLDELGIHLTESPPIISTEVTSQIIAATTTVENYDEEVQDEGQAQSVVPPAHQRTGASLLLPPTSGEDAASSKSPSQPLLKRRSDHAVLGDILHTVKAWTKLKVHSSSSSGVVASGGGTTEGNGENKEERQQQHNCQFYAAFMTEELIPCFEPVHQSASLLSPTSTIFENGQTSAPDAMAFQHPAVRGVDLLLRALSAIDAFSPAVDEIEGKGYIHQLELSHEHDGVNEESVDRRNVVTHEEKTRLVMGMKKRHYLVSQFVSSLEGEICNGWPYLDRTSRISSPSLHYNAKDTTSVVPDDDLDEEGDSDEMSSQTTKHGDEMNVVESKGISFASKNALRLAALVERCILARLVTAIHLHRQDPASAMRLALNYILCTAPSLGLQKDCYPRLPPVQSICIIEAILLTSVPNRRRPSPSPEQSQLIDYIIKRHGTGTIQDDWMLEALHVTLTTTASIYQSRSDHSDSRISEIGRVEVAAYRRLMMRLESAYLLKGKSETLVNLEFGSLSSCINSAKVLANEFQVNVASSQLDPLWYKLKIPLSTVAAWILPLVLTVQGDSDSLRFRFTSSAVAYQSSGSERDLMILLGCASSIRQLEIRKIDYYREVVASTLTTKVATISQSLVDNLVSSVLNLNTVFDRELETILELLLGICNELSDGENALRLIRWYATNRSVGDFRNLPAISLLFLRPMARVISLERREDRRAAFVSQAMQEGLWVMRGVVPPERWEDSNHAIVDGCSVPNHVGTYAVDGSQGTPAAVERKLMNWAASIPTDSSSGKDPTSLDSLVAPQWRPNDLHAFDVYAPEDPTLMVTLSPSEKACALSHIASWKGVAMSLPGSEWGGARSPPVRDAHGWTWAGLARGEPLHPPPSTLHPNGLPPPTPVALILEDDAILVDRFVDRLDEVLRELPRDFHYCAVGYARPKNAPLVDCPAATTSAAAAAEATALGGGGGNAGGTCRHVKIPTMTWYLTGYLLSGEGARHLLRSLPVVGPVDAWIGRTMILRSNWENDYGHRVGVGSAPYQYHQQHQQHGRDGPGTAAASGATLSRKELRACLQFRAYCASVPLCHQKVEDPKTGKNNNNNNVYGSGKGKNRSSNGSTNPHWRRRDSDVVYSGHAGTSSNRVTRGGRGGAGARVLRTGEEGTQV